MGEVAPVVLGCVLGTLIWRNTSGCLSSVLSVVAVLISGTATTPPRPNETA
jgi:hypothetical protein